MTVLHARSLLAQRWGLAWALALGVGACGKVVDHAPPSAIPPIDAGEAMGDELAHPDPAIGDPGRVAIHRLNAT